MPATINGGGDQLARGAVRATFRSADVSLEKWADIFGADSGPKKNYSDSDSKAPRATRAKSGKAKKRATR